MESLGFPERGVAVALDSRYCHDPAGRHGFRSFTAIRPAAIRGVTAVQVVNKLAIGDRSFSSRLIMGRGSDHLAVLEER